MRLGCKWQKTNIRPTNYSFVTLKSGCSIRQKRLNVNLWEKLVRQQAVKGIKYGNLKLGLK